MFSMPRTSSTPAASTNILKALHGTKSNRTIVPSSLLWDEASFSSQDAHIMLSVYTRHYPPCKRKNPAWCRCKCPKWIQGTLDSGEFVHRSAKTRSRAKAQKQANEIENPDPAKPTPPPDPIIPMPKSAPTRCAISTARVTGLLHLINSRNPSALPIRMPRLDLIVEPWLARTCWQGSRQT